MPIGTNYYSGQRFAEDFAKNHSGDFVPLTEINKY